MGQVESNEASPPPPSPAAAQASPPSMDLLIAEAAAYGDNGDENESLEAKAQKALECPCIADLRNGACGDQFSAAFLCFLKSTADEKFIMNSAILFHELTLLDIRRALRILYALAVSGYYSGKNLGKGSDCVNPFVALQKCIKANPDAFSKDVTEEEEVKKEEEVPTGEYKIIPPEWSREPRKPKSFPPELPAHDENDNQNHTTEATVRTKTTVRTTTKTRPEGLPGSHGEYRPHPGYLPASVLSACPGPIQLQSSQAVSLVVRGCGGSRKEQNRERKGRVDVETGRVVVVGCSWLWIIEKGREKL
ncbi:hypothetical protein ACFE04_018512 [Oxalis oulophora]